MRVDDDWTAAYDTDFTAVGESGDRPIVVSYGSDAAADVDRTRIRTATRPRSAWSRRRASRRRSTRACCDGANNPAGAAGPRRLHVDAAVPRGHAAPDVREPGRAGRDCFPQSCAKWLVDLPHPYPIDPADDLVQAQRLDQGVDRHRRAMTGGRHALGVRLAQVAVPVGFLAVFFVWPVAAIFGHGPCRPDTLRDVVSDPTLRHVGWFTTLAGRPCRRCSRWPSGFPAAYVVARYDFPGRRLFRAFVTVPFVLPTVVVATAFLVLFRPGGALVVSALATRRRPDVGRARVLQRRGGRPDGRRVLGEPRPAAGGGGTDARGVAGARVPRGDVAFARRRRSSRQRRSCSCSRSRRSAWRCFSSDPAHATLEVEIYRQAVELFDLPTAAALALVQIVAVITLVVVLARAQERRGGRPAAGGARRHRPHDRAGGSGCVVGGGARRSTTVFLGGPLAVLVVRSVHVGGQLGPRLVPGARDRARRPTRCSSRPWAAVRNSIEFAAIADGHRARGRRARRRSRSRPGRAGRRAAMDAFLMLPLGTSAVTVGFGFLLAFDHAPLGLRDLAASSCRSRNRSSRSRS